MIHSKSSDTAAPMRVLTVMGTRPEAVKLAPVMQALSTADDFELVVASTGQHREMLDQIIDAFGLPVHLSADIFEAGQSLPSMMSRAVSGLAELISATEPALVLVQGDTTSTFAGALAGFYADVPVVHLEAGLRTSDLRAPFPEEMNRRLTSQIASLHLAATHENRENLLRQGVPSESIVVTGNTVIDALLQASLMPARDFPAELRGPMTSDARLVLVTAHRRESWGPPMQAIAAALREIALRNPSVLVVFPIHRNPVVRQDVLPRLKGLRNVVITEPLGYVEFAHLMRRASLVVTDSGGIQEEAPSLGKPVLVMRDETERREAVVAGTARMVGTQTTAIASHVQRLLDDQTAYDEMARAVNPYGDGLAAGRVLAAIRWKYASAERPLEFEAAQDRGSAVGV